MDLVERLRESVAKHWENPTDLLNIRIRMAEAADEIERLEQKHGEALQGEQRLAADLERLRHRLERVKAYTLNQHDGTAPWTSAILDLLEGK